MDLDLQTVLYWLIIGVIALIGISVLGVLIDVAGAILSFLLKAGIVLLIVLLVVRFVDGLRS